VLIRLLYEGFFDSTAFAHRLQRHVLRSHAGSVSGCLSQYKISSLLVGVIHIQHTRAPRFIVDDLCIEFICT